MPRKQKPRENTKRRRGFLPLWIATPLRFFFKLSCVITILLCLVGGYYYHRASGFDMTKVATMPARTIVLDYDGNEYATLHGEKRRLISYGEIPNHFKHALFAREDEDFEHHMGVKLSGLARAAVRNMQQGKFSQGGSTLSMQLIKNTYDNREKTIDRKLLEIALTFRLEANYEKDEILTHYLNRIYFGAGCYGVEEAALTYFGKRTRDLHEGEAAFLVGIIRGPELFSPYTNLEGALEERDKVLERMKIVDSLKEDQVRQIKAKAISILPRKSDGQNSRSYTLQLVERHLKEILSEHELKYGGFEIATTIRPELVDMVDQFPQKLPAPTQSATVVLDSKSGAILAVNGGRNSKTFPWNIALDANRKLGSIYSPLLYLATMNYGEVPIKDEPVQSGRQIGFDKVVRFSQQLGLANKIKKDEDLYRGDIYSSPLKVATAYSVFVNEGEMPHTFIIRSVKNKKGELIYEAPVRKDAITPDRAVIGVSDMIGQEDQSIQASSLDRGKIDAWTVSTSPELTIVTWSGNNDSSPLKNGEQVLTEQAKLMQELRKLSKY